MRFPISGEWLVGLPLLFDNRLDKDAMDMPGEQSPEPPSDNISDDERDELLKELNPSQIDDQDKAQQAAINTKQLPPATTPRATSMSYRKSWTPLKLTTKTRRNK